MSRPQIVEIRWRDSRIASGGWVTIERHLSRRWGKPIRSVGVVLRDTKAGISLASSVDGGNATGVIHIPAACIRKRRRLR